MHRGHVAGDDQDSYFMPIHHGAKEFCAKYLSNFNDVHAAWGAIDKKQDPL